jgi:hypothetical protein
MPDAVIRPFHGNSNRLSGELVCQRVVAMCLLILRSLADKPLALIGSDGAPKGLGVTERGSPEHFR